MRQLKLWILAAILTVSGAVNVNAQTKEGEWFFSGWIGAGWSNFMGDIEDANSHGDRHLGMGACFHGNFFAIFLMVS